MLADGVHAADAHVAFDKLVTWPTTWFTTYWRTICTNVTKYNTAGIIILHNLAAAVTCLGVAGWQVHLRLCRRPRSPALRRHRIKLGNTFISIANRLGDGHTDAWQVADAGWTRFSVRFRHNRIIAHYHPTRPQSSDYPLAFMTTILPEQNHGAASVGTRARNAILSYYLCFSVHFRPSVFLGQWFCLYLVVHLKIKFTSYWLQYITAQVRGTMT